MAAIYAFKNLLQLLFDSGGWLLSEVKTVARKFWMDNVHCKGTEKYLHDCQFDGWGRHDCSESESVGVKCKATFSDSTSKGE